jgi:glycine/D-amino acid oxidase-like deaminating enzyme
MSDGADVVVIGAGIVGASIAYVLAKDGLDVVLMDGEGIGSGSTGHGHGVVSLVGKDFRPGPHFELGLAGARIFKQFTEMLHEDCGIDPMYHEKPGLSIAVLEEEERIFREAYAQLEDRQLGLRWVDGGEAREVEPRLSEEVRGGVLYWHGQVDGYRMTVCEAQALERLGGRVLLRRATGLLREGRRVMGVRHTGGELRAGFTVLAMGAWVAAAEEWIGFPIPVRPLHGEVLNVRLAGEPLKAFILTARHGPILQRKDGVILVGSIGGVTMSGMDVDARHVFDPEDTTPPVFDLNPKPENGQLMIERGLRVMPALSEADLIDHLAGVRPLSADRMPIIGSVPGIEGAILATGHGTKGIHLAPITARMVEDLVLHGENRQPIPYETFLPDRFAAVRRHASAS